MDLECKLHSTYIQVQLKDRERAKDLMLMFLFLMKQWIIDYGMQCLLVWSCVEVRGRSCLEICIRL